MTYLGIDFGLKKIGLAISDGVFPSPLPILTYNALSEVTERLTRLCSEHSVNKIIVGLPAPDKIGARKFGEKLGELSGCEVIFWDETLTTRLGALLPQKTVKGKDDSLAAVSLLESYLEST